MQTYLPNQIATVDDVTMIYDDPITRRRKIDFARIVTVYSVDADGMMSACVQYPDDELADVSIWTK